MGIETKHKTSDVRSKVNDWKTPVGGILKGVHKSEDTRCHHIAVVFELAKLNSIKHGEEINLLKLP